MPTRCAPVFGATVKLTVPLLVPLLLVVIHETLSVAVHWQFGAVVTLKLPAPPEAGIFVPVGLRENEQGGVDCCVIVKVCPAIVIVPVRGAPVLFAVTE